MRTKPDPRRVARLTVPPPLGAGELAHHRVHVLNLSPLGARIAHGHLLHGEVVCYLDLPPALGALRLTGRVAWTWLRRTEHTLAGDRRSHYESGIEFTNLSPDQQATLATVLATLRAAQIGPGGTPGTPDTPPKEAAQSSG
ncbi:MAG: hypothetical protein H6Q86_3983 [candidate division NC10 bacterium]|nr:hypothetical protein [candidate division NC10 bacterium]